MTNEEFSNSFDTLLNSYSIQANFGETSSKQNIVLDEYEKSVFLTQAQDAIVKSYFDRTLNQQGQGFDDSARRQIDFSSLIMVGRYNTYNKDFFTKGEWSKAGRAFGGVINNGKLNGISEDLKYECLCHNNYCYDYRGLKVNLAPNILFMLNEKIIIDGRTYIVVPINYNEYDREMSKAYAQPLKKQAWRLFSNSSTGYDIDSEIIPIEGTFGKFEEYDAHIAMTSAGSNLEIWRAIDDEQWKQEAAQGKTGSDITSIRDLLNANDMKPHTFKLTIPEKPIEYVIRYVRRPTPIILTDLPNNLSIDGVSKEQECELNPILHMDILNKAFELAVSTRGGGTMQRQQQESNQRQRQ